MKHKFAMVVTILALPLLLLPFASAKAAPWDRRPCIWATLRSFEDLPTVTPKILAAEEQESHFKSDAVNGSHIGCLQIGWKTHQSWLRKWKITPELLKIPTVNTFAARLLYNVQGKSAWAQTWPK